jgi:saccharopine dehydrogenase-like NADP-dependent oxidoreductase
MSSTPSILVLGAGLVAGPLVRHLADRGYSITLANRTFEKCEKMADGLANVTAIAADITDANVIEKLVPDADLVVSLVPYQHHVKVAEVCLAQGKHLVTTSYISPEMAALDAQAKAAGLTFVNELGLDPGIDHMSALQMIEKIQQDGGEVVGFSSSTGGLPAPEANDNPLGYKFSWSPRGVVIAGRNSGRFLKNGQTVEVPNRELFAMTESVNVDGVGELEVYTNRDCIGYIDLYGLKGVRDMFRGTFRYPGWCSLWNVLVRLGYLSLDERSDLAGMPYSALTESLMKGNEDCCEGVLKKTGAGNEILDKMKWLGLMNGGAIPDGTTTALDALTATLTDKLVYRPFERDMVVMQHRITVRTKDREQVKVSTLVVYGIPNGDSSMSRTVGLPAAVGADLILKGIIKRRGVFAPVHKDIYDPVLEGLKPLGLTFVEKTE